MGFAGGFYWTVVELDNAGAMVKVVHRDHEDFARRIFARLCDDPGVLAGRTIVLRDPANRIRKRATLTSSAAEAAS